ncbi:MAG: hypothetical protein KC636_08400 [Myxococcales bacterium]|nr:hypothetical protein [Myxococcales bacterium]
MPNKCPACGETVYATEEQKAIGRSWHKETCFKCQRCGKRPSPGSERELDGLLVCSGCALVGSGSRGDGSSNLGSFTGGTRPAGGTRDAGVCGQCGTARSPGSAFCSGCGARL